jgi:hypothetical protein
LKESARRAHALDERSVGGAEVRDPETENSHVEREMPPAHEGVAEHQPARGALADEHARWVEGADANRATLVGARDDRYDEFLGLDLRQRLLNHERRRLVPLSRRHALMVPWAAHPLAIG